MPEENKCLALVTDAFGGKGGIAQYNRDLLVALIQSGLLLSVAVLPRYAPHAADPPPGITQLPPRSSRIAYALTVLWFVRVRRNQVVFCGHVYVAALAALIARLTKSKLIMQMHGIEAWRRPSRLLRYAVEAADLVLCVSRYTRASVLDWAAIAPERVVVVPNTVAASFTPGDGTALRAELDLTGKQVLLTVGRR